MVGAIEELFDVVDEFDNVIDQRPRSEVHRLKLRHRAIHVFVFRSNGTLLIHRRADNKEEFPGVWTSSASGHVIAGESYDVSAPRELAEELGVETALTRLHKFAACEATSREFTELYSCTWNGRIVPDASEIAAIEWVRPDEIARRIETQAKEFSPAFRLLFEWYQSCGND